MSSSSDHKCDYCDAKNTDPYVTVMFRGITGGHICDGCVTRLAERVKLRLAEDEKSRRTTHDYRRTTEGSSR